MLRGSALMIVVALAAVTTLAGATAIRGRFAANRSPSPVKVVSSETVADSSVKAPIAAAPTAVAQQSADPTPSVAQPAPVAAPPFAPVIPQGETMLRDSVLALRTDSGVTVSFDRTMTRTRRSDKFEAFLRSTLGQIYGAPADSALARLPDGAIAKQGDLLNELPIKGIRIPVSDAWMLAVYPELRPGQDGPLVIRYRVAVTAASAQH